MAADLRWSTKPLLSINVALTFSAQYVPVGRGFVFLVKQPLPAGGVIYASPEEMALSG